MFTFTSTSQSLSPDITPPKNIVLVYSDSREGVYMTKDQLLPLVVYFKDSRAIDTFFDGFLFLGITGPSGGSYETGTANDKDWSWLLNRLLGSKNQVENLQDAAKEASKLLGKEITLKVIIVIPLPDPNLNFSERISKVRKYVDNVIDKFYSSNFENLRLEGFYWMSETAPERDKQLIKESCSYVHEKGFRMYWIPYFNAQGYENWKELGFDYVMLQPNFAFYDLTVQRFNEVTERIRKYNLTVEMELPMYTNNPNLRDWKQSFVIYLNASLFYKWNNLMPTSYYYANAFYQIYNSERAYYDLLYKYVKGTLTFNDFSKEYEEAIHYINGKATRNLLFFALPITFIFIISLLILVLILKEGKKQTIQTFILFLKLTFSQL
ncbi:MAG: DUF4855 domain-containing protein [Thermoproteota archaeon]